MISCFLTAKPNLHIIIIDIILTFMLGIYNYLCTFLDVRQGRHPCTLLVLSVFEWYTRPEDSHLL